jgi:hypothetical protein
MDPRAQVGDGEVVLRHIPGGSLFQAPRPRITSKNFSLRPGRNETGISVSLSGFTTPAALMARVGNPSAGSRIAAATVEAVRALGLDVVSVPLDGDPGHAEIRSAAASLGDQSVRRSLAELFQFVDSEGRPKAE